MVLKYPNRSNGSGYRQTVWEMQTNCKSLALRTGFLLSYRSKSTTRTIWAVSNNVNGVAAMGLSKRDIKAMLSSYRLRADGMNLALL